MPPKDKFYTGPVICAACQKDLTNNKARINVHGLIGVRVFRESKPEDPRVCDWKCFKQYTENQRQLHGQGEGE